MYNFDEVYSREELFQIQRKYYRGYIILELNYKKNNNRSVSIDRYKVIKVVPDVSFIDSPNEITSAEGIIFIDMIENRKGVPSSNISL